MKRIFGLVLLLLLMCCLSGCQVNWGGETHNLPWQIVAIVGIPFVIICFAVSGVRISKKKFVCSKCHHKFKPKWWKCIFSLHINDDRVLRCPHCKSVGMCSLSYEQD